MTITRAEFAGGSVAGMTIVFSWMPIKKLEMIAGREYTIAILPFCKVTITRDGFKYVGKIVLDKDKELELEPEIVVRTTTFAISYNQRLMTVMINGDKKYAERFDHKVTFTNKI